MAWSDKHRAYVIKTYLLKNVDYHGNAATSLLTKSILLVIISVADLPEGLSF